MNKIVAALTMSLISLPALADEQVIAAVPRVEADPTGMILFAVVFVGLIGGYAYVIWRSERKKRDAKK